MNTNQTDYSIYQKFNFEYPPVGLKFLTYKPEGLEQLDKTMALCEMVNEAQQRKTPFYITKDNEDCAGKGTLGMSDPSPIGESGQVGMKWGLFEDARANAKLNQAAPSMPRGTVNYVAFATVDKLSFEPDLMVIVATPSQAEIVMRAMTYTSGALWESKIAMVGACAWVFTYPYQSGNVNFVPTGMTFGMKARKVYPEGFILISIPYNWIPVITKSLNQMEWVLPAFTDTREEFMTRHDKVMGELFNEFQNA